MITTQDEIISGVAKLNDEGKHMVLCSVKGAMMNADYCSTGKIVNLLFCERDNSHKRKDIFKQLDKAEPGAIINLSAHRKGGATL
jgi:hypothetical protein